MSGDGEISEVISTSVPSIGLGFAIEPQLHQLAQECPVQCRTIVGVGQDHCADVVVRQPDHVTLVTFKGAVVMHDRHARDRSISRPMP